MKPKIDHIHVTVADIKRAEAFYDQLLPILGFDLSLKEHDTVPEHEYQIVEYHNQEFSFGIVNQRSQYEGDRVSRRRAGALHHLAFHVDSRAAVIVHPPWCYEEYCTDYYAFFFKDSEGIEYEIVNFARTKYFH